MSIFYFIKNSYSAQIEGSGLNLRIGYTCLGIRIIPLKHWRKPAINIPFIYKIFIPFSIGLNHHSGQCNRRFIFKFKWGGFSTWYLTKGERKEKGYTGFHIKLRNPFK